MLLLSHPFASLAKERGIVEVGVHPETAGIVTFSKALKAFPGGRRAEAWEQLWRLATFRAIATHMICGIRFQLIEDEVNAIRPLVDHFQKTEVPIGVSVSLSHICSQISTRNEFKEKVNSPDFHSAVNAIVEILRRTDPFYILLDVSDEVLDNAPVAWSECLQGLLFFVLGSKSDTNFERVRIVATSTARVHRAAMRQPRYSNYTGRADVLHLKWFPADARGFLNAKIAELPDELVIIPQIDDPKRLAKKWLGVASLKNRSSGRQEKVLDYLIRHTRCTPRQLIILGNQISILVRNAKSTSKKRVASADISRLVHSYVPEFAKNMMMDLSSELVLRGIAQDFDRSPMNVYEGSNEDIVGSSQNLEKFFQRLAKTGLHLSQLKNEIETHITNGDSESVEILNLLWQRHFFGLEIVQRGRRSKTMNYANDQEFPPWNAAADLPIRFHSLIDNYSRLSLA